MKHRTRQQMAAAGLSLAFAAIGTPVGHAAFPDGDSQPSSTDIRVAALAGRVRHEPAPAAIAASGGVDVVSGGFDWTDAGIGAGIALAAAGLLAGGSLAIRRAGRRDKLATR